MKRERPGVLCVFGDHVPIMPGVYRELGEIDGSTDYLVWRADRRMDTKPVSKNIADLASVNLAIAQTLEQ